MLRNLLVVAVAGMLTPVFAATQSQAYPEQPAVSPTEPTTEPTAESRWKVGSVDLAVSSQPSVTYRVPAIVVTNRGTVLVTYDRRNGSANDLPNDIDVVERRSRDGGRTWDPPRTIVDYPGAAGCGDASMVVDRFTGRIFLFCTYSAGIVGFRTSRPGTDDTTDPYTLHVQVRHSDDDGWTWSPPTDLNPRLKDRAWQGYFASSGHGTQTTTGRLLQPLVVRDAAGLVHSVNAYSDDHGRSWHAGRPLAANTDESKAVELADGTIVQNSRPDAGGYRLVSRSADGGRTFTAAVPDPALPDPHINADEIRVEPGPCGPRRGWLLFTNAADRVARADLTVRLSKDNGATWPVHRLLHPGPSGYAAMAMLPDGRVGVLAETGTNDYIERITFHSFGLYWLLGAAGISP